MVYRLKVAGIERDLPLCPISPDMNIAAFVLFGDVELTERCAEALAKKVVNLRVFTDDDEKMNLSLLDIGGEALVVSNFTLLANYKKGNRPDYFGAAKPEAANELYEYFVSLLKNTLVHVGCGCFGADMQIDISANGPVTIVMDSEVLLPKRDTKN